MSEKYKLNGIIFEVKHKGDDNGADWTDMESDDISITLKGSNRKPEELGATLIKEPRKMTVWEWRNFPQVMFTIGNSSAYRWSGRFLEYSTSTDERIRRWNTVRSTDIEQLEAIGTEVV